MLRRTLQVSAVSVNPSVSKARRSSSVSPQRSPHSIARTARWRAASRAVGPLRSVQQYEAFMQNVGSLATQATQTNFYDHVEAVCGYDTILEEGEYEQKVEQGTEHSNPSNVQPTKDEDIDDSITLFRGFQLQLEEGCRLAEVKQAENLNKDHAVTATPVILEPLKDEPALYMEKGDFDYATPLSVNHDEKQQHCEEVLKNLRRIADEADFCSRREKEKLFKTLSQYAEAFATEQRYCKMNKLTPIKVELKPGHPCIFSPSRP